MIKRKFDPSPKLTSLWGSHGCYASQILSSGLHLFHRAESVSGLRPTTYAWNGLVKSRAVASLVVPASVWQSQRVSSSALPQPITQTTPSLSETTTQPHPTDVPLAVPLLLQKVIDTIDRLHDKPVDPSPRAGKPGVKTAFSVKSGGP